MKVKEESEKAGLKLSIQKTKVMASGLITWWQIYGGKVETVTDFICLGWAPKSPWMMTAAMKLKDTCYSIFISRSKRPLISWLQSPSSVILEAPQINSVTVSPFICHEVMGPNAMILTF